MKKIGLMTALGFASGLPLALSGFTLSMWLTSAHLALGVIGVTANIGLAYTLKFLWAPVFDEVAPPWLGRRRGWLLTVQGLLAACIAAMALSNPATHVGLTLALGAVVAFVSASQDILIDAWRIESFAPRQQGAALAAYVWGYRVAMLVSGAGVIALSARTGWHAALLLVAGLALIGPLATILAPEPEVVRHSGTAGFAARFAASVREPFVEFLSRRGAVVVIAFIVAFRLGEALASGMLAPYYTSLGFNRAAIAVANGPVSLVATLAGAALGGALVARLGVGRALLVTCLFQTVALLMYPALGLFPGHPGMLVATSVVESFAGALAYAGFLTYLSGLCNPEYTATQYALLSSLSPLGSAYHRRPVRGDGRFAGLHSVLHRHQLRGLAGHGVDAGDFEILSAGGVKKKGSGRFLKKAAKKLF